MDITDVFLILAVLGGFALGYFVMSGLDRFLNANRKATEKEPEKKEPSCVMLTQDMTDEEIVSEIRRFREKHECVRIVICDGSDKELSERMECFTEGKQ